MSTAANILSKFTGVDIVACTLEGGYAVKRNGGRILFESGRTERMTRNKAGRCTSHTVRYHDGSRLRFTWSPERGARYVLLQPDTMAKPARPMSNAVTP